jgi:hypothetical protein
MIGLLPGSCGLYAVARRPDETTDDASRRAAEELSTIAAVSRTAAARGPYDLRPDLNTTFRKAQRGQ